MIGAGKHFDTAELADGVHQRDQPVRIYLVIAVEKGGTFGWTPRSASERVGRSSILSITPYISS
jgi:hypothetical protein